MFDFLFRPKHKRIADQEDAWSLVDRYGELAQAEARRRSKDPNLSMRNRRHWSRVGRLAAALLREKKGGKSMISNK